MVQAMIVKAVVKLIAKQFKLDKILDYVENPNDADQRIDEVEIDVFTLKQQVKRLDEMAHEPRDFVSCNKCKKEIKEKKWKRKRQVVRKLPKRKHLVKLNILINKEK